MNILLINKFLFPKGGDAIVTLNTGDLLSSKDHNVTYWGMEHPENPEYEHDDLFVSHIDYSEDKSLWKKMKLASKILYSTEAAKKIKTLLERISPDIVHLHNFAHQISPSIIPVIKKHNIPVVMTVHDYKPVCASYRMLYEGSVCEKCRNQQYYWCLLRKCTKKSYLKSFVNTAEMYLHHKILDIYENIDIFIAPSRFMKSKLEEMGLQKEIIHLYNFLDTNEFEPFYDSKSNNICYFGRLSEEKGLHTLINAVKEVDIELDILGTGPIKKLLEDKMQKEKINNINFHGYKSGSDLKNIIKSSLAFVIPSEWYENNPRSVIEAFALGKPVIGSRIGGIPELVKDGKTGYTFETGNIHELRETINMLLTRKNKISEMGKTARAFAENKFNPQKHYDGLMNIYTKAINAP